MFHSELEGGTYTTEDTMLRIIEQTLYDFLFARPVMSHQRKSLQNVYQHSFTGGLHGSIVTNRANYLRVSRAEWRMAVTELSREAHKETMIRRHKFPYLSPQSCGH